MTAHIHNTIVPGCFRCEISADEAKAAAQDDIDWLLENPDEHEPADYVRAEEFAHARVSGLIERLHASIEVNGDLVAKIQYLVDYCVDQEIFEEGFCFPDGDMWVATRQAEE